MKDYRYLVYDSQSSKRLQGEIEADSMEVAAKTLQNDGYTILNLKEINPISIEALNNVNIGKIPLKQKVVFVRQLATMVSAGLPLMQALEILKTQNKGKFREILRGVVKDVEGGKSLGDSFAYHKDLFSRSEISLIKAAEGSGKFDEILNKMADNMEKAVALRSKVLGALIYPTIVLFAAIGVVVVILVILIPQLESIYSNYGGAQLPWVTESLVVASSFIEGYWWLILIILGVIFLIFRYYKSTPMGSRFLATMVLKIPVIGGIVAKSNVTTFATNMSLFISAGIPILDALDMIANSLSNEMFVVALKDVAVKVEKGAPLSQPIGANPIFPPILSKMIIIGESTGSLESILQKVADYFEAEVTTATSNLTKLMEPLTLVVMGGVVAYLAVAIYLPIYNLGNVIK